ncbi:helix-turn-helix domain-containing protein [Silvibacterium bohemicum]
MRSRNLRNARKWTQREMAWYLDLNRGHLSDIETGKREVG